jgi:hypothetical protein
MKRRKEQTEKFVKNLDHPLKWEKTTEKITRKKKAGKKEGVGKG